MKGKRTEVVLNTRDMLRKETEKAGMPIRVLTTDLGSEWMSDAFDNVLVEEKIILHVQVSSCQASRVSVCLFFLDLLEAPN